MNQRTVKHLSPTQLTQVAFCIILVFYGFGALLSQLRSFDQDEFQHLHSAWCIFKGLLPYRDYFDHHLPLYHYLVAPVFRLYDVEGNVADAIDSLFFARRAMWLLSGVILVLTFWLGKLWRNAEVGCVAVVFLTATEVYWLVTLQIRPDSLSVALSLLYLVLFVCAVRSERREGIKQILFGCSGVCLALAFLASQKIVYAFPGVGVVWCFYLFSFVTHVTRRVRVKHLLFQLGGCIVPIIFVCFYFYLHEGLSRFVCYNFIFNVGLERFPPHVGIYQFAYLNPYFVFFGVLGLLRSVWFIVRRRAVRCGEFILVSITLSLLGGLFVIPVPYWQYYLFLLPFVTLFAAGYCLEFLKELIELRMSLSVRQWFSRASLFFVVFTVYLLLIGVRAQSHWPLFVVPAYWAVTFLGSMVLTVSRLRTLALLSLLVGVSIPALIRLYGVITSTDSSLQIAEIRYGIENTNATDTVMDGFTGTLLFRRHAFFFWALPPNVQQRLSGKVKQDLLQDLTVGRIAPKLILFDKYLQNVSPEVKKFFQTYYEPTNTGVIWKRKASQVGD